MMRSIKMFSLIIVTVVFSGMGATVWAADFEETINVDGSNNIIDGFGLTETIYVGTAVDSPLGWGGYVSSSTTVGNLRTRRDYNHMQFMGASSTGAWLPTSYAYTIFPSTPVVDALSVEIIIEEGYATLAAPGSFRFMLREDSEDKWYISEPVALGDGFESLPHTVFENIADLQWETILEDANLNAFQNADEVPLTLSGSPAAWVAGRDVDGLGVYVEVRGEDGANRLSWSLIAVRETPTAIDEWRLY